MTDQTAFPSRSDEAIKYESGYHGHGRGVVVTQPRAGEFEERPMTQAELLAREPAYKIASEIYRHANQAGACYYEFWTLIAKAIQSGMDTASETKDKRLWLWKNFVDGLPEYWAFDNPYPTHGGGDPMTLGEPCGYAIFKDSTRAPGTEAIPDQQVIIAIKRARTE